MKNTLTGLALLIGAISNSHAVLSTSTVINYPGLLIPIEQGMTHDSLVEIELASPPGYATAVSSVHAQPGILKGLASSTVRYGQTGQTYASSYFNIEWVFEMTFENAHLTGQKGRTVLYGELDYDFVNLYAAPPGDDFYYTNSMISAGLYADSSMGSYGYSYYHSYRKSDTVKEIQIQNTIDANGHSTQITPGRAGIAIEFTWGEKLRVIQTMSGHCYVQSAETAGSYMSCLTDAYNSNYWGGIGEVTTNGEVVSDFSLISSDNIDLTQSMAPVPEPTAYLMFLTGIGVIVTLRRYHS